MNDTLTKSSEKAPLISAQRLSKSFGANRVLKDVSLDIRAGEILVLLGPNGAGKSTALNIIGGTLEPSEGVLRLSGDRDVSFNEIMAALLLACESDLKPEYHTDTAKVANPTVKKIGLSVAKAKSDLGWEPLVDIQEGMRRLVKWLDADRAKV